MCLYHVFGRVQSEYSKSIEQFKEEICKTFGGKCGEILKTEIEGFVYYSIVFIFNMSKAEFKTKLSKEITALIRYINATKEEVIEINI